VIQLRHPSNPSYLAVTPDGSRVYLATVSGTVLVIDTNSNAVTAQSLSLTQAQTQ
jgi:DNA-binding beta-propeller fold protein YncE